MKSVEQTVTVSKSVCRIYKVIVIGDPNVGKTCLTYRFTEGKFPISSEATIGVDFREKIIELNNEFIRLQLWDTAGQERFRKSMVPHYYRNVHAVVFVFDVTRRDSFEHLVEWIRECEKYNLANSVHRIIIGNKCDLEGKRVVSEQEAQKFADEYRLPLFETSAKKDSLSDNVDGIFLTIVHRLHSSKSLILSSIPDDVIELSRSSKPQTSSNSNSCSC